MEPETAPSSKTTDSHFPMADAPPPTREHDADDTVDAVASTDPSSSRGPTPKSPSSVAGRPSRAKLVLFVLATLFVVLFRPARQHVAAAELLGRFANPKAQVQGLEESEIRVPTPRGDVRAKLFSPPGKTGLPGVVLVHGVHYQGIDESRFLRFARSLADTGLVVLAPEIAELADYHVDPRSLDTIGATLDVLAKRTHRDTVGLMGMSFGGGMALLTASDPRFRDRVGFVVAVGAHDDLARTLRFFATSTIALPDGTVRTQKSHDYGAMVLVYNRVDDFFPAPDREESRLALRSWLQEKRDLAREHAAKTSPASKAKLEEIFTTDLAGIRPELLRIVDTHKDDDTGVSPHGHLAGLRAPVYLLHGADDTVIPASETLWLAQDVPQGLLRQAVVSAAIRHVEVEGEPSLAQKWELLHFMGEVLGEASRL